MYTRCTYCDSWLKVNAEQLRAGLGQVRCGSCEEVFSALANLTELSSSTPELEPVDVRTLVSAVELGSVDAPPAARPDALPREAPTELGDDLASLDGAVPRVPVAAEVPGTSTDTPPDGAPIDFSEDNLATVAAASVVEISASPVAEERLDVGTLPPDDPPDDVTTDHVNTPRLYAGDEAGNDDVNSRDEPGLRGKPDDSDGSTLAFSRPIYADPPLSKLHEDAQTSEPETDPVSPMSQESVAAPLQADDSDPNDLARVFDQSKAFDADEIPVALRADYARREEGRASALSRAALITLSVLALLSLPLQYAWFMPDDLVRRYPIANRSVERFCATVGCEIQVRQNRREIELVSRDVRIHPRYEGALQVQAVFTNRGTEKQTYPKLRFTLFNVNGDVLASRLFTPQEYLRVTDASTLRLNSGQTTQIQLDLLAPDDAAVSFEFEFI